MKPPPFSRGRVAVARLEPNGVAGGRVGDVAEGADEGRERGRETAVDPEEGVRARDAGRLDQ